MSVIPTICSKCFKHYSIWTENGRLRSKPACNCDERGDNIEMDKLVGEYDEKSIVKRIKKRHEEYENNMNTWVEHKIDEQIQQFITEELPSLIKHYIEKYMEEAINIKSRIGKIKSQGM